jgi:hypothetical protein
LSKHIISFSIISLTDNEASTDYEASTYETFTKKTTFTFTDDETLKDQGLS